MKKLIACSIAALMLFGTLSGCSKGDKQSEQKLPETTTTSAKQNKTEDAVATTTTTKKPSSAAVGEILDAPEVIFTSTTGKLYVSFIYPGDEEGDMLSMEIAADQVTDDMYVLYVTDGVLKLNEFVYEVTDDSITKYTKDVFMEAFENDTTSSQEELQAEVDSCLELLSLFMLSNAEWQNVKFCKTAEDTFALTGNAYAYDLLLDGELEGKILVDKASGLVVSIKDTDGTALYTVQEFKTSSLDIPTYK